MKSFYSPASRALQEQFDTRRLADRLVEVSVHERFTPGDRAFIERADMFFLATVDATGQPTCSYKGGDPGFITVVDDTTIAFPNYDGTGMYRSMGNVDETHRVGLLLIDFERQNRIRIEGIATIHHDVPLMARYPEAQFVVRVNVERVFPNCPRYIHKMQLVERSRFVPRVGSATPVPDWKRTEWASDVLPVGDPAREE